MTDEFDDSLEVGMAAGLDVPTAMAPADRRRSPPGQPRLTRVVLGVIVILLIGLLYWVFH